MSSTVTEALDGTEPVHAERMRILATLLEQVDALAEHAVATMRVEIAAYAAADDQFLADVLDQVKLHYRSKLSSLLEGRDVTLEDITFVRGAATRRARSGIGLEDYINAFRVGQQVFWEAVVRCAGETHAGHEAALTLATPLMRYCDFASTHAARAYVEFQQYAVADADRVRRDLLEHLLSGAMPAPGPAHSAAHTYGLKPDSRVMVATAVPVGSGLDPDTAYAASSAIARARLHEPKTLVVVRQAELVAVPVLRPGAEATQLCALLSEVRERLSREGIPLAMGVSTVATGVTELPRAYLEAHAALQCVPDEGGVAALPELSPFDYLALRADDTAWQLVDRQLRTFLDEDRARGGAFTATIREFADADLNLRAAAARLRVHPNTAQYRLRKIAERTGRNPRHIADLLDLLLAIALVDRITASSQASSSASAPR